MSDELNEQFARAIIKVSVKAELERLGCLDLELALLTTDLSRASFDAKSEVVIGAREAAEEVCARKPYIFGTPYVKSIPPPVCRHGSNRGWKI